MSTVANKIIRDVEKLHKAVEKLLQVNPEAIPLKISHLTIKNRKESYSNSL